MAEEYDPDATYSLRPTKQVICLRHDLHMRLGKAVAQGAHAAMWFLVKDLINAAEGSKEFGLDNETLLWLCSGTTKICVRVNSLEELRDIEAKAKEAALRVHVVVDAGHTEFHGEPTPTAVAIGPNYSEQIDAITGHLKLL